MHNLREFFQFLAAWKMWHVVFHGFVWLDWVLFAACVAAIFAGILWGFGYFLSKFIELALVVFLDMLIYPWCADAVSAHLKFAKPGFWKFFFFCVVSAGLIFLFQKYSKLHSKKMAPRFHPFWDKLVGAVTGFFFAVLALSFAAQFFLLLPAKKLHFFFERDHSRYGYVLRDFAPQMVEGVLTPLRAIANRPVSRSLP